MASKLLQLKSEAAAGVTQEQENELVSDEDRDSLHILPFAMIPVQTKGLIKARMIKNARFESVIEIFSDKKTGSGQIKVEGVGQAFGWPENHEHPDFPVLKKLAELPTYDVYSLRILLRECGIEVDGEKYLQLSEGKQAELVTYMKHFTRPLIRDVYGKGDVDIQRYEDLIRMFRSPDVKTAREKLTLMAEKLQIGLADVPAFLEDYGDTFLSLSYYRQILDQIDPMLEGLLESLDEIKENRQLSADHNLMYTCDHMAKTLRRMVASVKHRFEQFEIDTKDMWENITAERYREVEHMILGYHIVLGGALCILSVKLMAWHKLFPTPSTGGLMKRAEFLMSEMKHGISNISNVAVTAAPS